MGGSYFFKGDSREVFFILGMSGCYSMYNYKMQKEYMHKYLHDMLAKKDSGTWEHSIRVGGLCKGIAGELDLARQECADITMAGLLHDVGKIYMTDVINQPGILLKEQKDLILNHPQFGTELMSSHWDNLPQEIIKGIALHHERLDGSGYPFSLTNDNIPLVARIVAVADVYDAMSNARPYRPALSRQEINEELNRAAYDQDIVQALNDYLTLQKEIF